METYFHENVDDEHKMRYLFDVADKLDLGDGKVTEDEPPSEDDPSSDEESDEDENSS